MLALAQLAPELRLRRNYPYQGRGDGLTALLRKRHPDAAYVGIELEVNQRFVEQGGAPWRSAAGDARRLAERSTLADASDGSAGSCATVL